MYADAPSFGPGPGPLRLQAWEDRKIRNRDLAVMYQLLQQSQMHIFSASVPFWA